MKERGGIYITTGNPLLEKCYPCYFIGLLGIIRDMLADLGDGMGSGPFISELRSDHGCIRTVDCLEPKGRKRCF